MAHYPLYLACECRHLLSRRHYTCNDLPPRVSRLRKILHSRAGSFEAIHDHRGRLPEGLHGPWAAVRPRTNASATCSHDYEAPLSHSRKDRGTSFKIGAILSTYSSSSTCLFQYQRFGILPCRPIIGVVVTNSTREVTLACLRRLTS